MRKSGRIKGGALLLRDMCGKGICSQLATHIQRDSTAELRHSKDRVGGLSDSATISENGLAASMAIVASQGRVAVTRLDGIDFLIEISSL